MRILYHHRTLGDGAEGVHIREIQNALRELGHEVDEVSPVSRPGNAEDPKGKRSAQQSTIGSLKRFLPQSAIDMGYVSYNRVTHRDVTRALKQGAYDLVYSRTAAYSFGDILAAERHRVPVIIEANMIYSGAWARQLGLKLPRVASRIERYVIQKAAGIVTVSQALRKALIDRGVSDDKIIVSPNAIDPKKVQLARTRCTRDEIRQRWNLGGKTVIGFVGSFRSWHGIELMCALIQRVLQQIPAAHFLMIGDDGRVEEVKEAVQRAGQAQRVTSRWSTPSRRDT